MAKTSVKATRGDDVLIGTDDVNGNKISGKEGNDLILGSQTDDKLMGEVGDDIIRGKKGNDEVYGGEGEDIIEGNGGNDDLRGNDGNDILFGGVGNDSLKGGDGEDTFSMRVWKGGENRISDFEVGTDTLQLVFNRKHFVLENDIVSTQLSNRFEGEKLDTKVSNRESKIESKLDVQVENALSKLDKKGQSLGEDISDADAFVDAAIENVEVSVKGNDLILTFFEGNLGTSITLSGLAKDTSPLYEHLSSMENNTPDVAAIIELLTNPEKTVGSSHNDKIADTEQDDYIVALDGDDEFGGYQNRSLGNDTLNGGEGFDTANYWYAGDSGARLNVYVDEDGNIKVEQIEGKEPGENDNVLYTDTLIDVEKIVGTRGDDHYDLSGLSHGIEVRDNPEAGGSDDTFIGSDYADNVDLDHGDDLIFGGGGNDILKAQTGSNEIHGEDGDDNITGGNNDDLLYGGEGNDTIHGGRYNGNDTIDGGNGSDTIRAGGGDDMIYADQYAPAHMPIYAESDNIDGGDGFDTLSYNDTYKNADHLNVSVVDGDTFAVETVFKGEVTSTDTATKIDKLVGTRGDDVVNFEGLDYGVTYQDKWTGAGKDQVTGSDYDDIINVMNGDDIITGGGGNDYIDGGNGNDTIVYAAGTSIAVELNGPAYKKEYKIITNDESGEGIDVVKNIESIQIGDEKFDFGIGAFDETIG